MAAASTNEKRKTAYLQQSWIFVQKKITSKWIKDLSVRSETLNLLEESVGSTHQDLVMGNDVLNWLWLLRA